MDEFPLGSKLDRPNTRTTEQREPHWADVEVITLATREHHHTRERAKQLVDEAIVSQHYIQCIKELVERSDIFLDVSTRRNFGHVANQFRVYHRFLRDQLRSMEDIGVVLPSIVSDAARLQAVNLTEPDDSAAEAENISRVDNALRRSQRRQIFSLSDSHVTTAYMMKCLREQQEQLERVGIISFDHHTDLRRTLGVAKKENVMAHVLEQSGVGAVVIVGHDERFAPPDQPRLRAQQLDRISGAELYSDGRPDARRLERDLGAVFEQWRVNGITELYTSIDLDSLRLPEQLYTATDYNPLDNIRALLDLPVGGEARQRLQAGVSELSSDEAQATAHWLQNLLRVHQLTEYNGIPAAWVVRAMRLARDHYGLQLGIGRTGTEQRVIGDIVEYTPPDYANRTARITKALLGGMVKATS